MEEKLRVKALYRRALAREALGRFEEAEVDANLALKARNMRFCHHKYARSKRV